MRGNKIKKVCILTIVHPPFDTRIFHKQAKSLVEAGYGVTLVVQHGKDEVVDGVKIIALPKPKNRLQRMFSLSLKAFRIALKQRVDVYHFHDPELIPIGMLLKLFTKKKIIYDVHENVRKQILNKGWIKKPIRLGFSFIYWFIERISLPFLDFIIIAEDSYIENYRGIKKVIPVRNYPLVSFIEKNLINTSQKRIVYVGGVTRIRGAIEILKAFLIICKKDYNNVKLDLVGPIQYMHLKQEITKFVTNNGLNNYVNVPGHMPYEKVKELLSNAYLGLVILHPDPNYVESLPTKLFEYMSAGLPVIASNFPLWKEIVEGNNCGLTVNPLDPQDIADAIKYLLDRPELCEEMGKNGRRAVEEKYNWEKEGEKLINLYRELLE